MSGENAILIGSGPGGAMPRRLELKRANRHGLIAGATGTGKTITLQGLIEGFSSQGVPCFVADVKGDLAGLGMAGDPNAKNADAFRARAGEIGLGDYAFSAMPVQLWDLFGQQGHPVRATVSEMGPLLLGRLLDLNEVQEGVLNIAFVVADRDGLLLLDLDDLQSMLVWMGENARELTLEYGNVTAASIGAIQRALLQLRSQGGADFFGEPALDLADFMTVDEEGRGIVNILAADRLMNSKGLYATFLLWLLSELFEQLPEIGDPDKPRLCFFFDEAHLLFEDAPGALVDKVEQVVRLIRSKGVGVYFITQNPIDIPDKIAGQLNNRIQHKLNAFTPRDQQAVRAAADTFRPNPEIDVAQAITELKIGEALVSLLQEDGSPAPVERTLIRPPASRAGPLTDEERRILVTTDAIGGKYDQAIDRESAEEILKAKSDEAAAVAAEAAANDAAEKQAAADAREAARTQKEAAQAAAAQARAEAAQARLEEQKRRAEERERNRPSMADKMLQSAARSMASSAGRQIASRFLRGILGGLTRG